MVGDAITNLANAVMEAYGKVAASLGTIWINIGTPNLTGTGGSSPVKAGTSAPGSIELMTVLGYVKWIALVIAVVSLVLLAARVMVKMRAGEGFAAIGRTGLVLGAVVLIAGASSMVSVLLPDGPRGAGGAVGFLQSSLWWYMGAGAILSVIVGGARMAYEQRADPGKDLLRSLVTLIVVAGAGVTIIGLLVAAADSFSVWIINGSLKCDVTGTGGCFGQNIAGLLALTGGSSGNLGPLLIIILGLVAIIASVIQIVLMVARGGMLVILAGILPLAASATNTEMGKAWFKKSVSWLVAFILYKPAAAIVYAAAFQLAGTKVFADDGSGLLAVLTGLLLMIVALVAMPALMRFVTPMVGSLAAGGAGGAVALAGLSALPSGAAGFGRSASGAGGGGGGGAPGQPGANGAPGSSSSATGSGAGSSPSPTAATSSAKRAGAAASGGGASGAAAGGGATAGAAGGPVGIAAGAALDGVRKAGQATAGAAGAIGSQATGEGAEPSGGN
ncbi:MAG: hypothetical protein M0Z51_06490 [Propionibacterium sp.]|nr:hypothetical protein [Propionibacterium sp.]